jgi:hypothetical protein
MSRCISGIFSGTFTLSPPFPREIVDKICSFVSASENNFDLAAASDLKPFPWANRQLGFCHSSENWSNNKTFLFQINKRNNNNDRPRSRCITSILKLNYSMHVRQWATLYDQMSSIVLRLRTTYCLHYVLSTEGYEDNLPELHGCLL